MENLGSPYLGIQLKFIGIKFLPLILFMKFKCIIPCVIRDKQYKLIWNIAHPLPYPFASDLWAMSSFQAQYQKSMSSPYGQKNCEGLHTPS